MRPSVIGVQLASLLLFFFGSASVFAGNDKISKRVRAELENAVSNMNDIDNPEEWIALAPSFYGYSPYKLARFSKDKEIADISENTLTKLEDTMGSKARRQFEATKAKEAAEAAEFAANVLVFPPDDEASPAEEKDSVSKDGESSKSVAKK